MVVVGTVAAVKSDGPRGAVLRAQGDRGQCLGSVLMGGRSQSPPPPIGVRIRAKKGSQNGIPFL